MNVEANELGLLRSFEPVLRFAEGERFVPTATDRYVEACSLQVRDADGASVLATAGELSLDTLADFEAGRRGTYLQFVSEEERHAARWSRWRLRLDGPARLARVGLFGRVADVLFRLSLVLRGTVPPGVAAAASAKAERLDLHDQPVYYARVVRDGGWTVLHYMFFFAMNDWRSAFGGVNDHEADWEQVMVYCDEVEGELRPCWVAYASHDHHGDDLRRAWSDPEVERVGDHVVVYSGGGSHASYFQAGEYVTRIDVPVLRPLLAFQHWFGRLGGIDEESGGAGVPFVDRAPGDGLTVGEGGELSWEPRLLDPTESWIADFRGLWGLDTSDVTGGERAPAGPRFNRDGTVRQAWADPVGYAGLQKVAPPSLREEIRLERLAAVEVELTDLDGRFDAERTRVRAEVLSRSLSEREAAQGESRLSEMSEDHSRLESERRRLLTGGAPPVDLRAHLVDPAVPEPPAPDSQRRLLNVWSALSAPLMLGLIAALFLTPLTFTAGIAIGVLAMLIVEALLQRRLLNFLYSLAVLTLLVIAVVAGIANWRLVFGVGFAAVAVLVLLGNLRELMRRG